MLKEVCKRDVNDLGVLDGDVRRWAQNNETSASPEDSYIGPPGVQQQCEQLACNLQSNGVTLTIQVNYDAKRQHSSRKTIAASTHSDTSMR